MSALCEAVGEWKAASKVANISKDGAMLITPKALREGSEINLSMDVPGDNIPVFASCHVAWQKEQRRSGGEMPSYETGVRFIKIDGHDKGRLLEYIYTQWLKLLDEMK
jgi:hypothetical protein